MGSESVSRLRSAVARVCRNRPSRGRRYPSDLRRRIVVHVIGERGRGASVRSAAASLGVSYQTLLGWLQAEPNGFRAVAMTPSASETKTAVTLCLVTPQGHRVEGLDREDVVFLLRSLA